MLLDSRRSETSQLQAHEIESQDTLTATAHHIKLCLMRTNLNDSAVVMVVVSFLIKAHAPLGEKSLTNMES